MKKEKKEKKILENQKRIKNKVNAILFPSYLDKSNKDGYIRLNNINKIYDNNVQAVFDFNLDINKKEFIVFVGPSGCGKSTTLRMICGLEEITSGALFIDGKHANDLAPKDRDIAMVFQSYALYPHMSVYDNMAFSLKIRKHPFPVIDKEGKPVLDIDRKTIRNLKSRIQELNAIICEDNTALQLLEKKKVEYDPQIFLEMSSYYKERNGLCRNEIKKNEARIDELQKKPTQKYKYKHLSKKEIDDRIQEASKILQIEPFLLRKPKALSGGQRQRVALGRSIVRNAKVFLMDEPLSNLDAKLRVAMRSEIISLHKKINATTIYVTHDQTEAMTMADRIVVMKDGVVQQIGTPKNIYDHPINIFVATFIGSPAMNILKGTYTSKGIRISKNILVPLNKNIDAKKFINNEITRLSKIRDGLSNALLNHNDYNKVVYENAITQAEDLIAKFKTKLDGEFPVLFGVRPEQLEVVADTSKEFDLEVKAEIVELLGSEYQIHTHIDDQELVIKTMIKREINNGDMIKLKIDIDSTHYFDVDTEESFEK